MEKTKGMGNTRLRDEIEGGSRTKKANVSPFHQGPLFLAWIGSDPLFFYLTHNGGTLLQPIFISVPFFFTLGWTWLTSTRRVQKKTFPQSQRRSAFIFNRARVEESVGEKAAVTFLAVKPCWQSLLLPPLSSGMCHLATKIRRCIGPRGGKKGLSQKLLRPHHLLLVLPSMQGPLRTSSARACQGSFMQGQHCCQDFDGREKHHRC